MIKHIFYIVLICAVAPLVAQDEILVESKVDSNRIFIGDVITYTVTVDHDTSLNVQLPQLAENLGMFEIRDFMPHEPIEENGRITVRTDYEISTFTVGEYTIPELEIGYKQKSDSVYNFIKTEPITIFVESLNPDEAGDIRDIKMPKTPPRDWKAIIRLALLIALALAGLVFLFVYLKRRKDGRGVFEKAPEPPRPPHEIALEKLNSLVLTDLVTTGQVKQYISELSDIIREYIGGRFYVDALEMTTDQLLFELDKACVEQDCVSRLHTFLPPCDMVKFAKYIPPENEIEDLTHQAFDFVETTKLVYTEPQEAEVAETPNAPETEALPQAVKGETQEDDNV